MISKILHDYLTWDVSIAEDETYCKPLFYWMTLIYLGSFWWKRSKEHICGEKNVRVKSFLWEWEVLIWILEAVLVKCQSTGENKSLPVLNSYSLHRGMWGIGRERTPCSEGKHSRTKWVISSGLGRGGKMRPETE